MSFSSFTFAEDLFDSRFFETDLIPRAICNDEQPDPLDIGAFQILFNLVRYLPSPKRRQAEHRAFLNSHHFSSGSDIPARALLFIESEKIDPMAIYAFLILFLERLEIWTDNEQDIRRIKNLATLLFPQTEDAKRLYLFYDKIPELLGVLCHKLLGEAYEEKLAAYLEVLQTLTLPFTSKNALHFSDLFDIFPNILGQYQYAKSQKLEMKCRLGGDLIPGLIALSPSMRMQLERIRFKMLHLPDNLNLRKVHKKLSSELQKSLPYLEKILPTEKLQRKMYLVALTYQILDTQQLGSSRAFSFSMKSDRGFIRPNGLLSKYLSHTFLKKFIAHQYFLYGSYRPFKSLLRCWTPPKRSVKHKAKNACKNFFSIHKHPLSYGYYFPLNALATALSYSMVGLVLFLFWADIIDGQNNPSRDLQFLALIHYLAITAAVSKGAEDLILQHMLTFFQEALNSHRSCTKRLRSFVTSEVVVKASLIGALQGLEVLGKKGVSDWFPEQNAWTNQVFLFIYFCSTVSTDALQAVMLGSILAALLITLLVFIKALQERHAPQSFWNVFTMSQGEERPLMEGDSEEDRHRFFSLAAGDPRTHDVSLFSPRSSLSQGSPSIPLASSSGTPQPGEGRQLSFSLSNAEV